MSYDIFLFKPDDGESADDAFDRLFDESDAGPAALAHSDELKEKLAAALMAVNPRLERFEFDYSAAARAMKISEEEARAELCHIELNSPDGIQIQVDSDKATLTLPYHHQGAKARSVFKEVWQYLHVFQTEALYLAYDPQFGRPLDLSKDFDEALGTYTGVATAFESHIRNAGESIIGQRSKPWWKFW